MRSQSDSFRAKPTRIIWAAAAILAVLAPWIRNHEYLRDFLDYGLMMAAAGRIKTGEMPFTDFITPLQTATIWANTKAEALFGGTYQAMTMGNAVLIVVTMAILLVMLRRKFDATASIIIASAIVIGSLSQHTIIWYNALGVITLALVGWSTAVAPVLQRSTLGWHGLAVAGFLIGGTNKLNFHFVAIAVSFAWAIRSGVNHPNSWRKVVVTLVVWSLVALVCPLGLELLWSGATFADWYHSVIELATADRGGMMQELLTADFYLQPLHDHYGPVLGPVGAIIAGWLATTLVLGWPQRSATDRFLLVGSVILAMASTAGILATNIDIIYIALASGLTLIVAIWIGFDLNRSPRGVLWAICAPALLLSFVMWHSAWIGQRSQFGHSDALRTEFEPMISADGRFDYLRGTLIPPQFTESLARLKAQIPDRPVGTEYPYFYASGAEWLERIWPVKNRRGYPLWMAPLCYGPDEIERLKAAIRPPSLYERIIVVEAWENWPGGTWDLINIYTDTQDLSVFKMRVSNSGSLANGIKPLHDALTVTNRFGSNIDPRALEFETDIWEFSAKSDQLFLGIETGHGRFKFARRSNRLQGSVVLTIPEGVARAETTARFSIIDGASGEGPNGHLIWSETVRLDIGESERIVPYAIDSRGGTTKFLIDLGDQSGSSVRAGFTAPRVTHSGHPSSSPPTLRLPSNDSVELTVAQREAFLNEPWAQTSRVILKGGSLNNGQIELPVGGEIWIYPELPLGGLNFEVSSIFGNTGELAPTVRLIWSKGGRVEIIHQDSIRDPVNGRSFNLWPVESEGWFGLLVDHATFPNDVRIRVQIEPPQEAED